MPDRITADNDIASGTAAGGKAVAFSPAFKDLQGLAIVAENMATGDFYDIVSKDATPLSALRIAAARWLTEHLIMWLKVMENL